MINSSCTYKYYLSEDKKALGNLVVSDTQNIFNPYNIDYEIWLFQKQLRKCEYLYNSKNSSIIWKIRKFIAARKFKKLSIALGFTINPNCFEEGLKIAHRGTIIVNGGARIGKNCTINACVNIGALPGDDTAIPTLGKNIYIGPGAKIYGKIFIADNCVIGANAVVNKDCLEPGMLLVGVPAKAVKKIK